MVSILSRPQCVKWGLTIVSVLSCSFSAWLQGVEHQLHCLINTLRPRQNGRLFADNIFTCIFLNEKVWISINISLTFVPKGQINNIPALVQIMAWRRPGNKPLSEPMMFSLLMHICVARPQWVKVALLCNMVKFLLKTHSRNPIAHSRGWDMGCLLSVLGPITVLHLSLLCGIKHHVLMD